MLDDAATSDIGRAGRSVLGGFAGLLLASLDHELDDIHIDRGSENILQLLVGRFAQNALLALVGEVYMECYEKNVSNWYSERSEYNPQSTTTVRGIDLIG